MISQEQSPSFLEMSCHNYVYYNSSRSSSISPVQRQQPQQLSSHSRDLLRKNHSDGDLNYRGCICGSGGCANETVKHKNYYSSCYGSNHNVDILSWDEPQPQPWALTVLQ